jgi:hypothetical protein
MIKTRRKSARKCDEIHFIANSLYVRNNNVSPAVGGGYIIILIIYESAINIRYDDRVITNLLYVRNSDIFPAFGGGYIKVLTI